MIENGFNKCWLNKSRHLKPKLMEYEGNYTAELYKIYEMK